MRTLMRKSQVSALRDEEQPEKCRDNDRGNEPVHDRRLHRVQQKAL
jgi:hypothetical protein